MNGLLRHRPEFVCDVSDAIFKNHMSHPATRGEPTDLPDVNDVPGAVNADGYNSRISHYTVTCPVIVPDEIDGARPSARSRIPFDNVFCSKLL